MVVDHPARIVIATPAKCASTSFEGMAKRKVNALRGVELTRPGRHRMDCPPEAEGYRRLMLCRNPWARLVSAWSYTTTRRTTHKHAEVLRMSFGEYVTWWREYRAAEGFPEVVTTETNVEQLWQNAWPWLATLTEFASRWEPEGMIHAESLVADLAANGMRWGLTAPHTNASTTRPGGWTDYWTADLFDSVPELLADAETCGYDVAASRAAVTGIAAAFKLADLTR